MVDDLLERLATIQQRLFDHRREAQRMQEMAPRSREESMRSTATVSELSRQVRSVDGIVAGAMPRPRHRLADTPS